MKNVKKFLVMSAALLTTFSVVGCSGSNNTDTKSEVEKVIEQAEKMETKELYKKAMEELNGKTMYGIGNSSRGKTAQEYFINYLKGKSLNSDGEYVADETIRAAFPYYDENFSGTIEWSQPKNNSIFDMLSSDTAGSKQTYSMTLIQDGNQIQSKMLDTGILLNYIPKEWQGDETANGHPFALQSLNKVFEFNNVGVTGDKFKNVWDFVGEGEAPMFMGVNSEPVGKNFLYMLTKSDYAAIMKEAYDALPAGDAKTRIDTAVAAVAEQQSKLGLEEQGDNVKYSLAWIKLWMEQYNEQTDDGPICNSLVSKSAAGQSALIVYSKLRSVSETDDTSKKNVTVAAYQDGYVGIGGFMYKHYLQVLKKSPMPWTACAFIHYMTTTAQGFSPWGKDIGGYCSNASCNKDHSNDGGTEFPVINDKGYDWWTGQTAGKGRVVIEDPSYCSSVAFKVGMWIDGLRS